MRAGWRAMYLKDVAEDPGHVATVISIVVLLDCRVHCFVAGGGKGEGGGDRGCEGSGGSAGEGEEADASRKGPPPPSCYLSARICPGPCGQMSVYVHWGWRRPVSLELRGDTKGRQAEQARPPRDSKGTGGGGLRGGGCGCRTRGIAGGRGGGGPGSG